MQATETEERAHQGNLQEMYTATKKLSVKFRKPERPVRDKGRGLSLMKKARRRDGWNTLKSY